MFSFLEASYLQREYIKGVPVCLRFFCVGYDCMVSVRIATMFFR